MKRLHIHLAVENLEQNIEFYSTMFGCQPSVQHEDYAKWMLDDRVSILQFLTAANSLDSIISVFRLIMNPNFSRLNNN
jgi:catechol 2,3-dioxygenase-like lactoylglutathione lyase family enzyme